MHRILRRTWPNVWLLVLSMALTTSCGFIRITHTPMPREAFAPQGPERARGAIILLPGFGDRPSSFADHGFVDALKRNAPGYDVFAADAHFGYYRKRTLLTRLESVVVAPLRARGYRELWIAGASMGGHGAVAFARKYPDRIAGVMLFAPYMGPSSVVEEVRRAGGLCRYQAPRYVDDADGFARANFAWLRRAACDEKDVSVWLAVGASDRLLAADKVLADVLDPSHVLVLPGGHGWKVWTPAVSQLAARAFPQAL